MLRLWSITVSLGTTFLRSHSNIKSHVLQTNFLVDVVLKSVLVLELFLAVLTGVDGGLGMLDDHVPAETESVSRARAAKFTSIEL